MILGLFLAMLIMDVTTYSLIKSKANDALEHSLDAALVGAVNGEDVARGKLTIDESKGKDLARDRFKEALKLDDRLENDNLRGTTFFISFAQNGERPKVTGEVKMIIRIFTPQIFGLEGIPVMITKNRYHILKYK